MKPEPMIGEADVTDAIDEAMARAICAAGGIDPDALNGAAGVVWKLYLTDARAARSAHLAALERAGWVVQQWRPIETAPRDASLFLGWGEECGVRPMLWRNERWVEYEAWIEAHPTHWLRLPAFPAAPPPQNSDEVKP